MLSLLHIENIAVIESADIQFDKGFNALTGETGAGSSVDNDVEGSTEYDTEVFADEEFKYQCPSCGFRFN